MLPSTNHFLKSCYAIGVLSLLIGCVGKYPEDSQSKSSVRSALAEEAFYKKNFNYLNSYQLSRYLYGFNQDIQHKLSRIYPSKCSEPSNIQIIDRLEPLALTTANGQILISSGLISKLHSEDEFYFVLAHENAHIANCDLQNLNNQRNLEQELQADLVASNLLIATNRPISAAYSAINRLYEFQTKDATEEHPSQTTRLKNLNRTPKNFSYRNIASNQQFINFQREIQELSQFLE